MPAYHASFDGSTIWPPPQPLPLVSV